MSDTEKWSPRDVWSRLRLETETVKHYPTSYSLYIGQTHRDLLLDQLIPTLIYVKAASILDDSIVLWLSENGHVLKKPYRADFNGRLCYLGDNSLYDSTSELHRIRQNRNNYAHKPGAHCNWSDLESDMFHIERCLIALGLAQETKKLEYYAERSAMQESDEPNVAFTRRFSYGVKENGKSALEIAFNQNIFNV